jgi:hypothetical protein
MTNPNEWITSLIEAHDITDDNLRLRRSCHLKRSRKRG